MKELLDDVRQAVRWVLAPGKSVGARVFLLHLAAAAALGGFWYHGALTAVLAGGGTFVWAILVVAAAAAGYGTWAAYRFDTARRTLLRRIKVTKGRTAVSWLEWADSAVLLLGFLGTLQGAIIELAAFDTTATGDTLVSAMGGVLHGLGIAIYSTVAGAAASFWLSLGTRTVSNAVEAEAEKLP